MQGHCIMLIEIKLYLHLLYHIPTVLWIQLYFHFQPSLPRELPQVILDLDRHKQKQAHCTTTLLPINCQDKPIFQSCPGLSAYATVKDMMHFQLKISCLSIESTHHFKLLKSGPSCMNKRRYTQAIKQPVR